MKKLFVIIPSIFIIFLFIVLNYLLWDRQNKIAQDTSKDSTIAALGREIQNMETTGNYLRDRINKQEEDLKTRDDKINELTKQKNLLQDSLNQKTDIIDQLKTTSDLSAPIEAVKNWLNSMAAGQYETAYQFQTPLFTGQQQSQEEFVKQCKSKISAFKVLSDKPVLQPVTEDKKGEIVFKVTVGVTRIPDSGKFIFEDGQSDKLLTVIYNNQKNIWLISDIK